MPVVPARVRLPERPTVPEPPVIVSTSGFGEPWWIPGDEYDDSSRLDWARAL